MAVTPNSIITTQAINTGVSNIAPADTTTAKTIITGGTNGTRVKSINITSNDTAAEFVTIGITRSATFYPLTTISIPIKAGQIDATNPPINAMLPIYMPGLAVDVDGNPYIDLKSGDTLDWKAVATITAAKTLTAVGMGGDF